MLRQYDEDNPVTYPIDSDGDMVMLIALPIGLREEYLAAINKAKTVKELVASISRLVTTINDEPAADVLNRVTHLSDINVLVADIVANSWLPENASKNLPPSPDVSPPEKSGDATNDAEKAADNVSTTPGQSFAEDKACQT